MAGYGHPATGFVGSAVLGSRPGTPPRVRAALAALARFAVCSGTGARTTHGFGATDLGPDGPVAS
ncbi:CRISPR system precrRNA processing endoribonuclease RAMP protein Cas6 [Actinocorallia sp. API 0066]|uniref:CRISPR system precrRNA processing endoribonuclease RAMP protein Cas6 n=1 Tax=Actinocorallia sp. API 0066 TaxID=2896846 RepID=UPI001E5F5779|nr:CRISPR system precrRNA processing endoribonuclease RAMP protein Cas6 [Actinocorallia sp. API 0066]